LASAATIPTSRRTDQDRVIRGDEHYLRRNIDRPITFIDFLFSTLGGHKYGIKPQFAYKVRGRGNIPRIHHHK
jgi:hypothetical protein